MKTAYMHYRTCYRGEEKTIYTVPSHFITVERWMIYLSFILLTLYCKSQNVYGVIDGIFFCFLFFIFGCILCFLYSHFRSGFVITCKYNNFDKMLLFIPYISTSILHYHCLTLPLVVSLSVN